MVRIILVDLPKEVFSYAPKILRLISNEQSGLALLHKDYIYSINMTNFPFKACQTKHSDSARHAFK